jgi:hypothetical protein
MEYVEILSTGLSWYAIGGVAILMGSAVVYGFALLIYALLARLGTLISHVLSYVVAHVDASMRRHHLGR